MKGINSITFNNQRLADLGVGCRTTSRPTSPEKKVFEFSPSARDGVYDFSTYNPDNRPHYEPMDISLEIMVVKERDIQSTQRKVQDVMRLLHSANGRPADLIFDDSPNRIYRATFMGSSPITGYEQRKGVVFTITFRVDPFPRSGVSTHDLFISGYTDVTLPVGSFYTKPVITLTGQFTKVTIKHQDTGRELVYSGVSAESDTTIIDFETESVTKNSNPQDVYMSGDYWELSPYSPTTNRMTITVDGFANVNIKYPLLEVY